RLAGHGPSPPSGGTMASANGSAHDRSASTLSGASARGGNLTQAKRLRVRFLRDAFIFRPPWPRKKMKAGLAATARILCCAKQPLAARASIGPDGPHCGTIEIVVEINKEEESAPGWQRPTPE